MNHLFSFVSFSLGKKLYSFYAPWIWFQYNIEIPVGHFHDCKIAFDDETVHGMNRDPESINTHTYIYIDWIDIITEMRSLSFFFCVGKFFIFVLFVGDSGHRQKKLVQTNALREYDDTFRFISKEKKVLFVGAPTQI